MAIRSMHRIGARDTICNVNFSLTVSLSTRARRDSSVRLVPRADRRRVEDGDARHASREFVKMSNIRGFRDVNDDKANDSDRGSDGPDPQEWYTGGASSGQAVIDPRERPEARLAAMFDGARAHGAVSGTAEDLNPNAGRSTAFQGRGRTLNSSAEDDDASAGAPAEASERDDGVISRVITFWQNGFTVDDGPLRAFDDPANMAFMESIGRGEAPAELAPKTRTQRVNINLVQRHEPYSAPKFKAFGGSGRTLASEPSAAASEPSSASTKVIADDWVVDESQPTTSIQIRLRDGSRLVAKFNMSHTVAHIRAFIAKSRPSETAPYSLQLSGFPPKTLSDDHAVIGESDLAGAVVIQR